MPCIQLCLHLCLASAGFLGTAAVAGSLLVDGNFAAAFAGGNHGQEFVGFTLLIQNFLQAIHSIVVAKLKRKGARGAITRPAVEVG